MFLECKDKLKSIDNFSIWELWEGFTKNEQKHGYICLRNITESYGEHRLKKGRDIIELSGNYDNNLKK